VIIVLSKVDVINFSSTGSREIIVFRIMISVTGDVFIVHCFQSFLESNLKCVWNRSLVEAMQVVKYEGYVSPGVLLLTGDPCSMEVIRGAWCRNVLRPPNSYVITKIGKIYRFAYITIVVRKRIH
jgi:hypothetical protein